jgi:hypothetical protein
MNKMVKQGIGVLALAGGAVHVLAPLGIDVLSIVGGLAMPVQIAAGLAGVWVAWTFLK